MRKCLPSASKAKEKDFDLTSAKVFLTCHFPFQGHFVDCLKEHVPSARTPSGPPLWVVVHVTVKCIEGLYDLWRVMDVYTLTQLERHRALTTKFSRTRGCARERGLVNYFSTGKATKNSSAIRD